MANQSDEYYTDPYQAEEDELAALQQRMYAQLLRSRVRQPIQVISGVPYRGETFGSGFARARDEKEARHALDVDIPSRRRALSGRITQELDEALTGMGASESERVGARNPLLRATAIAEMSKRKERERQMAEYNQHQQRMPMQPGQPGQPGAAPSLFQMQQQLIKDMGHPNARIAAEAKHLFELTKNQDPSKVGLNPATGQMELPAGALAAFKQFEETKRRAEGNYQFQQVPQGDSTQMMTTTQASDALTGGGPKGPGTVAPPPSPQIAPSPSPNGGIAPSSGAPGGGPPPGRGSWQDPNVQIPQQLINMDKNGRPFNAEIDPTTGKPKFNPLQYPIDPERPWLMKNGQLLPDFGRPSAPERVYRAGEKIGDLEKTRRELRLKDASETLKKMDATARTDKQAEHALTTMLALNQGGTVIGGPAARLQLGFMRGANQLTGMQIFDPTMISDSEFYEKLNLKQLRDSLQAFGSGTGISNLDLITAQRGLPGRENTPEGRRKIIEEVLGVLKSNEINRLAAQHYSQVYGNMDGFVYQNYDKDGNHIPRAVLEKRLQAAAQQKAMAENIRGGAGLGLGGFAQDLGRNAVETLKMGVAPQLPSSRMKAEQILGDLPTAAAIGTAFGAPATMIGRRALGKSAEVATRRVQHATKGGRKMWSTEAVDEAGGGGKKSLLRRALQLLVPGSAAYGGYHVAKDVFDSSTKD